ncbi:MAG: hypothetical protein WD021_09500 [Rhodothermales bacterium]
MSVETTHIIKGDDVAATRAVRPDPSVLLDTLKIPRKHVQVTGAEREERPAARKTRVPGEEADVSNETIDIVTRAPEKRKSPAQDGTRQQVDEEDAREPTLEEVEAEWAERLESEVAAAREDAFADGQKSVRAEANAEIESVHERFAAELDAVRKAWEDHLENSQVRLVQLAFRIARAVLDAPLPDDIRRISEAAITDAVERMVDGVPVEVAVHPVTYLRFQESGLEERLSAVHSKLRWHSDPGLKENEWVVQCDRSAIRRLESELLDELQRELSVRDVHADDRHDSPDDESAR